MDRAGQWGKCGVAVGWAALAAAGCAATGANGPARIVGASIRDRTATVFALADFYKPRSGAVDESITDLAPLIVQQVAGGGVEDSLLGPFSAAGSDKPVVYFGISQTVLRGQPFERIAFLWRYGPGESRAGLRVQGVRMTLDVEGFPMIWEVLGDPSGARVVYVARWLEEAAGQTFGSPLPHRRFAVERAAAEAPGVVVARVLEDGPVPMGPFVYLESGSRAVSTLTCRCMPSQVDAFATTTYYDLKPLEQMPPGDDLPAAFSNQATEAAGMDEVLRLPPL